MARAETALRKFRPDEVTSNAKAHTVTASVLTPNGMVVVKVQVFIMTSELRLVEIKKVRGDALKYGEIFADIRATMADLASKASARGFGGAAAGGGSA
jgi:hypothetical protein